ncbi:dynamin family protein [Candidatus Synechococcus calcipolaris G9]|uniref:Dynamin family protein n=1 Tax=Candidatus Synechococcus calcipolaris G9 TaxID=1497997 RepID=A0ABT6F042_9SYNE|nr:dynamin family protein [Candidatus Synechococcus calcipolaris]MDG2991186.1 dynamin family protein [Candidatus Synechococcus calcipolaris G9]
MSDLKQACPNLQDHVSALLKLLKQEPSLRVLDTTPVQTSLNKALSPTFEIVFAGPFSAGKSMLINALLERELLYSSEGHATGTECRIAYAEPTEERAILTFMSQVEIQYQVRMLLERLALVSDVTLKNSDSIQQGITAATTIIQNEGGKDKSEKAKQANALKLLLEGYKANETRINETRNNVFAMESLNFQHLNDASEYARQGANSAVLKKIEYYCHHPLLAGGNVLIDTPGIDAPVKEHAELSYRCIENPETSAVVCVFQVAKSGELTREETQLLEKINNSVTIRDRVFYVFNRIDETWYNPQLRHRLQGIIQDQFYDSERVYRTSGLLGFYGSLVAKTNAENRYGLDSIFAKSIGAMPNQEDTHQFVDAFNRYCVQSGKLPGDTFQVAVFNDQTQDENYVRILNQYHKPLISHLISDSGIEDFRYGITRYLKEEKYPQLLNQLAEDLQIICISLKDTLLPAWSHLRDQPTDVEALKEIKLQNVSHELKEASDQFTDHIKDFLNRAMGSQDTLLEKDYERLCKKMVEALKALLNKFSIEEVYQQALASHRSNSVVPVMGILAEAFYYLANGLKKTLVEASEELIQHLFVRLKKEIGDQSYYRDLYRLLGNDSGIHKKLDQVCYERVIAMTGIATIECDRYVREREDFYQENTGIFRLREVLRKVCRNYDLTGMKEAEKDLLELLKLDFEHKLAKTIHVSFRQSINSTINEPLLMMAAEHSQGILQQSGQARENVAKTIEREAEESIQKNANELQKINEKIATYNQSVTHINHCLEALGRDRQKLPEILESDLHALSSASS